MKNLPQISEAEYEVMKVIWKYTPINTNEVTNQLLQTTSWGAKTIQTMLKRLVQKGALSYEKDGRVFVYSPLIKEEDYLNYKSNSFLNRYYNGNLKSLLTHYLENEMISEEEISELRDILAERSNKMED